MPRPQKYREIIAGIVEQAARGEISEAFSAHDLCKRFSVSKETILKALRPLQKCGMIRMTPGQKIRLLRIDTAKNRNQSCNRGSAPEKLADVIERRIAVGEYPTDQALPKAYFFCRENHVSSHTCAKAMQLLLERGKIRREGKRWIVGSGYRTGGNQPYFPYVIGILQRFPNDFSKLCGDPIWARFTDGFLNEAIKYGVSLRTVRLDAPVAIANEVAGKKAFAAMIKKLGNRYLGSLIITPKHGAFPCTVDWLETASAYTHPTIWLCRPDNWAQIERESEKTGKGTLALYGEWRDSETTPGMAALAIDTLYYLGHRNMLFIDSFPKENADWFTKRLHNLRVRVRRYEPHVSLNVVDTPRRFIFPKDATLLTETAKALVAKDFSFNVGSKHQSSFRQEDLSKFEADLLQTAAVLLPALRRFKPTAIIAPNDGRAVLYRTLLNILGLRIPRYVSLLSFDNSPQIRAMPLSSIDFGLYSLGYRSFHTFYGDLQRGRPANRIWADPKPNGYSTCGQAQDRDETDLLFDTIFESIPIDWRPLETSMCTL